MRKLLARPFLILLGVSPLAVPASAQMMGSRDTTSGPTVASTGFSFGVQALDVDAFNASLAASGFPGMRSTAFSTGFGTAIRFGAWDLSFAGSAVRGSRDDGAAWRTESNGNALMVGVGYAAFAKGRWRVVPMVGAGLTRIRYHVEEVRGGTLDSALADPLRGVDLEGQTGAWHAGVGVEYRLGSKPRQRLGITGRVGYARPWGSTDWRADHNDLSAGPRAAYGGIYARVGMSFGMPRRRDALIPSLVSVIPWLARKG